MSRSTRAGRSRPAVLLVVAGLLVAGCGTRLDHAEHVAAAGGRGGSTGSTASGGATGPAGSATSRTQSAASSGAAGDATTGANTTGTAADGTAVAGADGGTDVLGGDPAAASAAGAKGAPIRVGMIGNFGGIAGASFSPARDSLKAWAAMINAKGGVNGHPFELLIADDGNDGANDLSIAKDYVENRGVIALVNYFGASGGPPAVEAYAREKRVPVIGGAAFDATFYGSPFMFPQVTGDDQYYYSAAKAMADRGLTKVAIIYCTEGSVCKENADHFTRFAKQVGVDVVYSAGVSLAQPDFTAECINARAAGATAWYPQVDGNSENRLARSCARQGYDAKYYITAPVDPPDPLLEGGFSTIRSFPWFLTSGSPALDEYGQAMAKYAPNTAGNSYVTAGWMSGKLLEKAAEAVGDQPTSEDLLNGLWSMDGETFGGISPAMTFVRDQPPPGANCAFYVEVKGGKWTAPDGMELTACM